MVDPPDIFGFHSNAEISKDLKEQDELLRALMFLESGSMGAGDSAHNIKEDLLGKCHEILQVIPKAIDLGIVEAKYPISYNNSMHSVLL